MKAAPLEDVAGAILDGAAVDWSSIDSRPEETDPALVKQLRTLAALRLVARRADVPSRAQPTHWGHLQVLERIGHGAFGEVYRAWDTRLDREVALKLLPVESLKGRPEGRPLPTSIIEEGRLLARVRHPNVVTIYGAERIDGRVGLWMELVKGRTLEQTLRDGPTFTAREATRIGVELCRAVSAVHAAGLLHRDIKAQNVMVAEDGRLVLMDFGTGRELASASEANVAGTPLYLAPEVLAGAAATPQSDVYSIGVLLYHLLTGLYPVQGRDLTYLRRAHAARDEQTDPGAPGPTIPPRLGRVIAQAIDPKPQRRYASVDSFGAALSASERVPATLRTAYAFAAAVVIIALGWMTWGQRELLGLKSSTATPVAAGASAAIVDAPVILVLPFKNLSSEKDSYFADGLTSEVIRNLSPPLIEGLQVRSQTSSLWFKDKQRDLAMIREQLGADFIVEGDVLLAGSQLRINARLVQVAGDEVRWSDTFPGTLDDVFAIQDKIALGIANQLRLTLGKGQRNYRTNVQAYDLYLKALAVRPGRGEGRGPEAAIDLFKQVIAIDPNFAPAFAGLAGTQQTMAWNIGTGVSPDMRPAAVRALELDPLLADAEVAMVSTYTNERDWMNATKSFDRALELNPNLAQAYTAYSDTLTLMGQPARALQLVERARSLEPLSLTVQRDLAMAQFFAGRYEDAIANLSQILAADPEFNAFLPLVRALTVAGRHEEAIAVWKSRPGNTAERWLARAYSVTGRKKELDRLVTAHKNAEPYHQAIIYAGLQDKDRTFDALTRAADRQDRRAPAFVFSPETEFLRGDPRLDALKKKMKLP